MQLVLLYGSDSWVVTGDMLKVLTASHNRAAQHITGMRAKHGAGGELEYLSVYEAMDSVVLQPIRLCINRRQKTIAEKVAFRTVYELCAEAERMPGMSHMVRWWDQDAVNEPEE